MSIDIENVLVVRAASKDAGTVRDSTAEEYRILVARLVERGEGPEHAKSRPDFYRRRAALVHAAITEGRAALTDRDRATRTGDAVAISAADAIIARAAAVLRRYPPGADGTAPGAITWSSVADARGDHHPTTHSKRRGLGALTRIVGWQDALLAHVTEDHRAAVAVAILTGARPSEIAAGVQVAMTPDGLVLTITGAKCSETRGQPSRTLLVSSDSEAARLLIGLAAGEGVTVTDTPKRLSDAIATAGKRAFPHLRVRVSGYTLRHAAASALKAAGAAPGDIAGALGHAATRSQSVYGRACHATTRTPIMGVSASAPVRDTAHQPPPLRPSSSPGITL